MTSLKGKTVLISGASSGIGRACAMAFAAEGCKLALGARRIERLEEMSEGLERHGALRVFAAALDVRDPAQVDSFVEAARLDLGSIDILINNAGLARGLDQLTGNDQALVAWQEMMDTNVMGLLYMTRKVVPLMVEQGGGHVINLTSVASHEVYEGGSVYAASKHAALAISQTLRLELLGKPIRVTAISPGLVETEFSVVRFSGDEQRASNVYAGLQPLTAEDIAECIVFAANRPPHVDIDEMIIRPLDQAAVGKVARRQQLGCRVQFIKLCQVAVVGMGCVRPGARTQYYELHPKAST